MHPWTRINLILALLLGALLLADQWPAKTSSYEPLTEYRPADIDEIRVERGDRLILSLRRSELDWHMDHPEDRTASPKRVGQLLTVLEAPTLYRFAADNGLARFGLAEPELRLNLAGPVIGRVVLGFGDREPGQTGRYVLVEGQVKVVDDLFFNLLSLPARHYAGD